MNKTEKAKLEKNLRRYFKEIHQIYTGSPFREESFYPSFKRFFEEFSHIFRLEAFASVLVLPRKTEVGIPDFRIGKNGEIIGYIEAKTPRYKPQ
ncbi:MAG: hypothetical protein ACOYU0_04535 [Nitrospirota bacterium]